MKNIILLRSANAHKASWEEVCKGPGELCQDMYVCLWRRVCELLGCCGEVWWVGWSPVLCRHSDTFIERGVPVRGASPIFKRPSMIFNRGGFPKYAPILQEFSGTPKMYYGAGSRFLPSTDDYSIIYYDSYERQKKLSQYKAPLAPMIKPAVERFFRPVDVEKKYDVLLMSSSPGPHKGYAWFYQNLPQWATVLRVGRPDQWSLAMKRSERVTLVGPIERAKIAEIACQARVGVVMSEPMDGCPRILSEMLAMDIPILVRAGVTLIPDLYLSRFSGCVCSENDFADVLASMLARIYQPAKWYSEHLSMEIAAKSMATHVSSRWL